MQEGMFLDGTLYATIARNMAKGLGSFWAPCYTVINDKIFYGHPPMAMAMEALLFKCFGDHLFVERMYSFLMGIISMFLIIKIWKVVHKDSQPELKLFWLPVLLWAAIPVVSWSYANNMLDNTQCFFCLLSSVSLLQLFVLKKSLLFYSILAAIFIFLALITKGPLGLFPIAIPFVYWISIKNAELAKVAMSFFIILLLLAIISFTLMNVEESKIFIQKYIHLQLFSSLSGSLKEESRFFILQKLGKELLPIMIISLIVMGIYKIKNKSIRVLNKINRQWLFFFLFLAIASSFPIMVSNKQMGFYLIPSMPYYALAFSLILLPVIKEWMDKINIEAKYYKVIRLSSVGFFAITIGFSILKYGKIGREVEKIKDIKIIGSIVGADQIVGECPELYQNWGVQAYFGRYYNISLDKRNTNRKYIVLSKTCSVKDIEKYQKMALDTKELDLYELK